jgi:phage shock protein A
MQEQMNTAMATLNEAVGQDVPTFDEVQAKIEARYAKATSMAELTEQSVESNILEIEQAARNVEAQARLNEIRSQLGITPAPTAADAATDAIGEGTPAAEPVAQAQPEPQTAEGAG